jgi:hypothetical protein
MPPVQREPIDRFMAKVEIVGDCWLWRGNRCSGYAYFFPGGDRRTPCVRGHRWSYEHFVGPVPDGLVLGHTCEHRHCVNPEHVRPITQSENIREGRLPALLAERNRARAA